MNYRLRLIINGLLKIIIKVINFIPLGIGKSRVVAKLSKFKLKIYPKLFDNNEFLSYVKKKKHGLEENLETVKTLAFRGSVTDYSFYAPIWKDSYNLGLTSTDLYTCYHLYKNYKNRLKNLENIILFFNIPSPGYSLVHTTERYRAVAYKYFFNIPYLNDDFIDPVFEKVIFNKCSKLKSPIIEKKYKGYEKKTYYGIKILAKDRVKTHIRENKREPNQLHWIESLNELINKDNRRLVIVLPPVRNDYKELLPSQSVLFKKLYNIDGINVLNYYDSKEFTNEDHGDTDHLNEKGAIKLTNEIIQVFRKNNWI